jgi:hypothetical protein
MIWLVGLFPRSACVWSVGDGAAVAELVHRHRTPQAATLCALRRIELGSFCALLAYPFAVEPFRRCKRRRPVVSRLRCTGDRICAAALMVVPSADGPYALATAAARILLSACGCRHGPPGLR